jgi:tripartite-type tricarboxylate transporter receptor subunit TctC
MRQKPYALLIGLTVGLTGIAEVDAQYPTRPLRIIVPTSTGGSSDTVARLISQPLSERLGQQVVVENRAGAASTIGTETVARSAPDGYTLLMSVPALATNPSIYKKLPYDALRDFAPVTLAISQPHLLVVHPSLPARSVKELIALAKARPGDIVFASAGNGSNLHLAMELFLGMTGTRMLHVPYKGPTPGIVDLGAGRVWVMMPGILPGGPHVRTGRLRALGVTSRTRAATMPDLPTVAETGVPGYESTVWNGLLAPANTPNEIIARLHKEVTAVLLIPVVKDRLSSEGAEIVANSPGEFSSHIRAELLKWAKVVKSAGIQPE